MVRTLGTVFIALCFMPLFQGCAQPETQEESALQRIESRYVGILDELTSLMSEHHADPAENLEALRSYVATNRARIGSVINELNRDYLALDETSRSGWRHSARSGIEGSLDAYSRAQLALNGRLNEAQKWELGEILSQLKK